MDLLLAEAIRTYASIQKSIYDFEFSDESISVKFEDENFYHLFGFHYLENLNTIDEDGGSKSIVNKSVLFKGLVKHVFYGKIENNPYYKKIRTSTQFSDLESRLELVRDLAYFLDTNITKNSYWKYSNPYGIKTHIQWDYLIEFQPHFEIPKRYYLFLRKDNLSDYYVPVSLFKTDKLNHGKEYSYKQSRKDIKSLTKRCDVI